MGESTQVARRSVAAAPEPDLALRSDQGLRSLSEAEARLSRLERTLNAGPRVRQLKATGAVIQRVVIDDPLGQPVDLATARSRQLKTLLAHLNEMSTYQNPRDAEIAQVEAAIRARKAARRAARRGAAGGGGGSSGGNGDGGSASTSTSSASVSNRVFGGIGAAANAVERIGAHGTSAFSPQAQPLIAGGQQDVVDRGESLVGSAAGAAASAVAGHFTGGASSILKGGAQAIAHAAQGNALDDAIATAERARGEIHQQDGMQAIGEVIAALTKARKAYLMKAGGSAAGAVIPFVSWIADHVADPDITSAREALERIAEIESSDAGVQRAVQHANAAIDLLGRSSSAGGGSAGGGYGSTSTSSKSSKS